MLTIDNASVRIEMTNPPKVYIRNNDTNDLIIINDPEDYINQILGKTPRELAGKKVVPSISHRMETASVGS